ncbi:TLC domain-containing protein [Lipomyces arxii]|uniref:TLC domain-containing protein n=1 Tax=Lipomyces arxii TaxID=56418 RepID=UPI0034CE6F2B
MPLSIQFHSTKGKSVTTILIVVFIVTKFINRKRNGLTVTMAQSATAKTNGPFKAALPQSVQSVHRAQQQSSRNRQSLQSPLARYLVENQIAFPLYLISTLIFVHLALPYRHITSKFFFLSHRVEHSGLYVKGPDDLYLVLFWIAAFTLIRAFAMEYIYIPIARYQGVKSQKALIRFAEQTWSCTYYIVFWSIGMYLMYHSPYWLNTDSLWIGWPHRELKPLFKWYYLVQLAFWFQQIYVIQIEQRRKDHHQMFTHHIVTCTLLIASYNYCFTRVGNAILVLMDVVDIVLCSAKMLRYLGHQKLCDITFGLFFVTWIIAKHILYLKLLWSATFDSHRLIGYKCFSDPLNDVISVGEIAPRGNSSRTSVDNEQCFTEVMQYSFISLLWILQFITIAWLYMIIKVAAKVLSGKTADDSRSDDEDEEEIEIDEIIDDMADKDIDENTDSGVSIESSDQEVISSVKDI